MKLCCKIWFYWFFLLSSFFVAFYTRWTFLHHLFPTSLQWNPLFLQPLLCWEMWSNISRQHWVHSYILYAWRLILEFYLVNHTFHCLGVLKFTSHVHFRELPTLISRLGLLELVQLAIIHLKQVQFHLRCLRFWLQRQHLWDLCLLIVLEFKGLGWGLHNHPALLSQHKCNQP